jgi:hypothetical protein
MAIRISRVTSRVVLAGEVAASALVLSIPGLLDRRICIATERRIMKYLCLAFYDPARLAAMPPEEVRAMVGQCPAKDAELKASGHLRVSASLGGADKAVTIRPRGGRPEVKDGPFTESKEVVGGFVIIEAGTMEEALKIARLHPAAELGEQAGWGIEMHPIAVYREHA